MLFEGTGRNAGAALHCTKCGALICRGCYSGTPIPSPTSDGEENNNSSNNSNKNNSNPSNGDSNSSSNNGNNNSNNNNTSNENNNCKTTAFIDYSFISAILYSLIRS